MIAAFQLIKVAKANPDNDKDSKDRDDAPPTPAAFKPTSVQVSINI
jgi:hypothetical protein